MRTVVLGGYGNFGARICRALAEDPAIELVVAGRNGAKAAALADALGARHAVLDAEDPAFGARLLGLRPDLVVHTAGPYQQQGYGVAAAAAAARSHYIDLADGRRFVCDFAKAMDAAFVQAGRVAVTGASTAPALSSAVVDALLPQFGTLEAIDMCIAPAQAAPRGQATLAGVLSYCGKPVQVWREGRWVAMPGWGAPETVRFARLKPRLGALCDIPDLELFPARYVPVRDVMFRAALEVRSTQRAFAALSWLGARGLLRKPERLAALLHRTGILFDRFGTPDGGMVVRMQGTRQGRPGRLAWHITAPDNHGPEIPCMAAIVLARRLARGDAMPPGARPCLGLVPLDQFQPEFAHWGMTTQLEEEQ